MSKMRIYLSRNKLCDRHKNNPAMVSVLLDPTEECVAATSMRRECGCIRWELEARCLDPSLTATMIIPADYAEELFGAYVPPLGGVVQADAEINIIEQEKDE